MMCVVFSYVNIGFHVCDRPSRPSIVMRFHVYTIMCVPTDLMEIYQDWIKCGRCMIVKEDACCFENVSHGPNQDVSFIRYFFKQEGIFPRKIKRVTRGTKCYFRKQQSFEEVH